jgi:hypothetical protein
LRSAARFAKVGRRPTNTPLASVAVSNARPQAPELPPCAVWSTRHAGNQRDVLLPVIVGGITGEARPHGLELSSRPRKDQVKK